MAITTTTTTNEMLVKWNGVDRIITRTTTIIKPKTNGRGSEGEEWVVNVNGYMNEHI